MPPIWSKGTSVTKISPVKIYKGDCRSVLPTLETHSIDAVITDPPYPEIDRQYGRLTEKEWHILVDEVVEQCRRILKPTGSAMFIIQPNSEQVGKMRTWWLRFMLEWAEKWGMVQDVWWWNYARQPTVHCNRQFGLMRPSLKPCVWLGSLNCYRNQDAVLLPPSETTKRRWKESSNELEVQPSGGTMRQERCCLASKERGGTTPFNVLPMTNANSRTSGGAHGHGAATPLELVEWWVKYICPTGGTILDPFAGSGTTALAALVQCKKAILIEKEDEYVTIMRHRLSIYGEI